MRRRWGSRQGARGGVVVAVLFVARSAPSCGHGGATALRELEGLLKYAVAGLAVRPGRILSYVIRLAKDACHTG